MKLIKKDLIKTTYEIRDVVHNVNDYMEKRVKEKIQGRVHDDVTDDVFSMMYLINDLEGENSFENLFY